MNKPQEFGYFECDLIFFKSNSSSSLLALIECQTKKDFIIKNPNKLFAGRYNELMNENSKAKRDIIFDIMSKLTNKCLRYEKMLNPYQKLASNNYF
jgi:IS30 family transposase